MFRPAASGEHERERGTMSNCHNYRLVRVSVNHRTRTVTLDYTKVIAALFYNWRSGQWTRRAMVAYRLLVQRALQLQECLGWTYTVYRNSRRFQMIAIELYHSRTESLVLHLNGESNFPCFVLETVTREMRDDGDFASYYCTGYGKPFSSWGVRHAAAVLDRRANSYRVTGHGDIPDRTIFTSFPYFVNQRTVTNDFTLIPDGVYTVRFKERAHDSKL